MLKFSKTMEYAFRIMDYLAKNEEKIYSSDAIYKELEIPFRYLRRLLTKLTQAGLLNSIRGKLGGYKITKSLENISLYEIAIAIDEKKSSNLCFFGYMECPLHGQCAMHEKWRLVQDSLDKVLKDTTLEDLKENAQT